MYVDDLTLFDASAGRIQVLVDRLASFAQLTYRMWHGPCRIEEIDN
jgi:hypothetical protein